MTKLIIAFRNFTNAPNYCQVKDSNDHTQCLDDLPPERSTHKCKLYQLECDLCGFRIYEFTTHQSSVCVYKILTKQNSERLALFVIRHNLQHSIIIINMPQLVLRQVCTLFQKNFTECDEELSAIFSSIVSLRSSSSCLRLLPRFPSLLSPFSLFFSNVF